MMTRDQIYQAAALFEWHRDFEIIQEGLDCYEHGLPGYKAESFVDSIETAMRKYKPSEKEDIRYRLHHLFCTYIRERMNEIEKELAEMGVEAK